MGWGGWIRHLVYAVKEKKTGTALAIDIDLGIAIPCLIFGILAQQGGNFDSMLSAVYKQSTHYLIHGGWQIDLLLNRLPYLFFAPVPFLDFFWGYRLASPLERRIRNFDALASAFLLTFYLFLSRFYNYYWTGFGFIALALVNLLTRIPWRKPQRISKLFLATFSSLCFVSAACFSSCYYFANIRSYSANVCQHSAELVLSLDASARQKEGAFFVLDAHSGAYEIAEARAASPYFSNQSFWSEDNAAVVPAVKEYLASSGPPTYLLVGVSQGEVSSTTRQNFGDELDTYYTYSGQKSPNYALYIAN